jgi:hypothetical protein
MQSSSWEAESNDELFLPLRFLLATKIIEAFISLLHTQFKARADDVAIFCF